MSECATNILLRGCKILYTYKVTKTTSLVLEMSEKYPNLNMILHLDLVETLRAHIVAAQKSFTGNVCSRVCIFAVVTPDSPRHSRFNQPEGGSRTMKQ